MFTMIPVFLFSIISYVFSQLPLLVYLPPAQSCPFYAPLLGMLLFDAVKLLSRTLLPVVMNGPLPPLVYPLHVVGSYRRLVLYWGLEISFLGPYELEYHLG